MDSKSLTEVSDPKCLQDLEALVREIKEKLLPDIGNIVYEYATRDVLAQFTEAIESGDYLWFRRINQIYHLNSYGKKSKVGKTWSEYYAFHFSLMEGACNCAQREIVLWMLSNYTLWLPEVFHPKREILGRFHEYSDSEKEWEVGLCKADNPEMKMWLLSLFEDAEKRGVLPPCEYDFNGEFIAACWQYRPKTAMWCIRMARKRPEIRLDYAKALDSIIGNGYGSVRLGIRTERVPLVKALIAAFSHKQEYTQFVERVKAELAGTEHGYVPGEDTRTSAALSWMDAFGALRGGEKKDFGELLPDAFRELATQGYGDANKIDEKVFNEESKRLYAKAARDLTFSVLKADKKSETFKENYLAIPGTGFREHLVVLRVAVRLGATQIAEQCEKLFGIVFCQQLSSSMSHSSPQSALPTELAG